MHFLILTGVQKGHNNGWESGPILLKYVLLQINFEVEGQFYTNCYYHILAFQYKYFLF